jgi:hypothetical protein
MSESHEREIVPVPLEEGEIVQPRPAGTELEADRRAALAVIPAAAAAGGFVAGAAIVGLIGRRHRRARALGAPRRSRALGRKASVRSAGPLDRLQIVGSRSLLVDVHLLGGPGAGR